MFKPTHIKNCKVVSLVLFSLLLLSVSCSKNKDLDNSIAILKSETASSHSVTFDITPLRVEKCAWMCVKDGETAPSVAEILSKGISVDVANRSRQTAFGLDAETAYIIYVAAQRGGTDVQKTEQLAVSTTEQQDQSSTTKVYELNNMIEALYSTDNAQGNGNYYISLSSCPVDEEGMPISLNGVVVKLDMFGPADEDPVNATLPSGEYTLDSSKDLYFGKTYSFIFKKIGSTSDDVSSAAISSGKINVARNGDDYTIDIDLVLSDDETFKATYNGPILFVQSGTSSYYRFDEPQNVNFTSAFGRYYGNWFLPHADDLSIQFSAGTLDSNGNMVDGYVLNLPIYMEKLKDTSVENPVIKSGVYNPTALVSALNYLPYTYEAGLMEEIFGSIVPMGTYLQRIDGTTGKKYIGFATEGTITISESDGQYEITFDFVSEKGIAMTGKYVGAIDIANKCNNDQMPERPWSTLTEDVALNFPTDAKCNSYFMSNYLYPSLNSWVITLASDTISGEMITTEFFTPKEDGKTIKPGVYTVAEKFEPYCMLPGFQPYGTANVAYTWFGDLSTTDSDGYASKLAPIVSGTMTIAQTGDSYTFTFDFVDDAGKKITGSWTGAIIYNEFIQGAATTSARSAVKMKADNTCPILMNARCK